MRILCVAVVVTASAGLAGCMTSSVMDTGNGTYMISARAAPIMGGVAGATQAAYKDATAYCSTKGGHAVVISATGSNGPLMDEAGNTDLRFRCE